MRSQDIRKKAPEMDSLRIGMGWSVEDLSKPQIMIESTFGDSHPGSVHLFGLVEQACDGVYNKGPGRPGTLQRIFVMVRLRGMMVSIIPWYQEMPLLT